MGKFLSKVFCIETSNTNQNPQQQNPQPSQHDLTIINLKSLRDDLFNQKKRMNQSIEKTIIEIKSHLANKNKEQAKYAIKRKKLYEEYLNVADSKYLFIQKAIMEVEKSIIDKDLNDVMKQTNALLKDIQKTIDMDVLDEMKDNFDVVENQKNAFNNLFDQYNIKDELEDEYQKYEANIVKDQFMEIEENPVILKEVKSSSDKNIQNNIKEDPLEEKIMQLE